MRVLVGSSGKKSLSVSQYRIMLLPGPQIPIATVVCGKFFSLWSNLGENSVSFLSDRTCKFSPFQVFLEKSAMLLFVNFMLSSSMSIVLCQTSQKFKSFSNVFT